MNQKTDEECRELGAKRAELRKQNAKKYRARFAELSAYMDQCRKEALELMRRRHAYYTKLIADAKVKTAQQFYDIFKEQFLMYGIELKLSEDKLWCTIYLELGDYDYEDYSVRDGKNDGLAEVTPNVSFKEMFSNVEVNIFTEEEL